MLEILDMLKDGDGTRRRTGGRLSIVASCRWGRERLLVLGTSIVTHVLGDPAEITVNPAALSLLFYLHSLIFLSSMHTGPS